MNALCAALGLSACARDPRSNPEGTLASWIAAMTATRGDLDARRGAYEHLCRRARESLTQRAARASQLAGRTIHPWETLALGRFAFDPESYASRVLSPGDRAVVTVSGPSGERVEVPMGREGNDWCVDLSLPPMALIGDGAAPSAPSVAPTSSASAPTRVLP